MKEWIQIVLLAAMVAALVFVGLEIRSMTSAAVDLGLMIGTEGRPVYVTSDELNPVEVEVAR